MADVAKTLANTMGLFLQKTNIIRDFLEDYVDGRFESPISCLYFLDLGPTFSFFNRSFLPQEIWQQYTVKKPTDLGNT